MADVGFYHLTRSALSEALPRLLARTLASGQRALVVGGSKQTLAALSEALWAQPEWLPHGSEADGDPDLQPIWLAETAEPLNGARYLFIVDNARGAAFDGFERVFTVFDGNDAEAVAAAREQWKAAKAAGHTLVYWQQTATGWQKKA